MRAGSSFSKQAARPVELGLSDLEAHCDFTHRFESCRRRYF